MPRAVLKYKLPEEQDDFDLAYNGAKLSIVIEDLDNYLRGKLKYEQLSEEQYKLYQEVRDKLTELRNE